MRDEGDRFVAWRLDDASGTPRADLEDERLERALLAYAQRSAARVGAEWFAAEFARREEEERLEEACAPGQCDSPDDPVAHATEEITLVDASVEDAIVGGAPTGLGLAPTPRPVIQEPPAPARAPEPATSEQPMFEPAVSAAAEPEPAEPTPAMRHPHVPRPPRQEPVQESKRRRRHRKQAEAPTPSFVISAPEWARMSPGARRLYGLDASPPAA
jgi:hypothetical protein